MDRILRNKRLLLGLLGLLTLFFFWGIQFLKIDFSFDSFFPRGEDFTFYESYRNTFQHDDNLIHIAIQNGEQGIFDRDFLQSVDSLFGTFSGLKFVDTIIVPTRIPYFTRTGFGVKKTPRIDFSSDEALALSRERLSSDSLFMSGFISKGNTYIAGMVMLDQHILDLPERDTICNQIEEALKHYEHKYILSGVPYIRTRYVEKITTEMITFIFLSIILVSLVLFVMYRTWWGVLIPLSGVIISLIWIIGFMGWTGKSVDLLIELLPPIMFVVGMADVIHLITRYLQEIQDNKDPETAMRLTLEDIGAAIFLTSLTTAIGFMSLLVSKMPPMQDFGMYTAAGVMFAYVISIILVPNVLIRISPEKLKKSKGVDNLAIWEKMLSRINVWVNERQKLIIVVFLGILGLSIFGMSRVSFNAYLMDDLSHKDPIRANLDFFDKEFYGVRPFELAIIPKDGRKATDLQIVREMDRLQAHIRSISKMSPFLSPPTIFKEMNRVYHFNRDKYLRLPRDQDKLDEMLGFAIVNAGGDVFRAVYNEDYSMARMSARMPDIGTDNFEIIRKSIANFYETNSKKELFDYKITGSAQLAEQNIIFLRQGLFSGLGLAFVIIALIMGFLFKSWKMTFIALVPNLIPLLFTAGIMGLAGISLNASTSITFVISFGIAVDDTIHFLSRYRMELNTGCGIKEAIRRTLLGTGKALMITTLILAGGFILLLTSQFGGTFVIGLFVSITLIIALVSDLFLLPVLINLVFKNEENRTKSINPDQNEQF